MIRMSNLLKVKRRICFGIDHKAKDEHSWFFQRPRFENRVSRPESYYLNEGRKCWYIPESWALYPIAEEEVWSYSSRPPTHQAYWWGKTGATVVRNWKDFSLTTKFISNYEQLFLPVFSLLLLRWPCLPEKTQKSTLILRKLLFSRKYTKWYVDGSLTLRILVASYFGKGSTPLIPK